MGVVARRLALGVIGVAVAASGARAGVISLVAASGQTVGGRTLTGFFQRPDINDAGRVVYVGTDTGGVGAIYTDQGLLLGPGSAVGSQTFGRAYGAHPVINNNGVVGFTFTNASGSGTYVATTGGTLVDLAAPPTGSRFLSIGQVAINDAGAVIFDTSYVSGGNVVQAIASPTAIVTQVGNTIDGLTVTGYNGPEENALNAAGTVVFRGSVAGGNTYLFSQSHKLLGTGSVVAGVTLNNVNPGAAINDAGHIAFVGFYGSTSGVFTDTREVMARGTVVAGHTLNSFDSSLDLNESGQVAYLANYAGGGSGIFVDDALAVGTGDVVDGRTIASLGRPALNDGGEVAAYATFTDGSSGIITAAVPEPGTAGLGLLIAGGAGMLRRRRVVSR